MPDRDAASRHGPGVRLGAAPPGAAPARRRAPGTYAGHLADGQGYEVGLVAVTGTR
ncbi:hypothetical protein [Micromonospora psammae]|uniref:hypothetical protein n=1 Tax=Micromonospora sp. CPCC 205556 TaxID=3122398 RepID=UPI002FF14653